MEKRRKIAFAANDFHRALTELEKNIAPVKRARELAIRITGRPLKTVTGEKEVQEFLKLPDYSHAPANTAAEMMGLGELYESYKSELARVEDFTEIEVKAGKVQVGAKAVEALQEKYTTYLKGQRLAVYEQLENACKALNKVEIAQLRKAISFSYQGEAQPDVQQIMMLRI